MVAGPRGLIISPPPPPTCLVSLGQDKPQLSSSTQALCSRELRWAVEASPRPQQITGGPFLRTFMLGSKWPKYGDDIRYFKKQKRSLPL